MYYTREQHKRFLDKELQTISEKYLQTIKTEAIALISSNQIYVSRFVKINHGNDTIENGNAVSGQLILYFNKKLGIPRKNEYFTAVILGKEMSLPKNWGNLSWAELRQHQAAVSEVHCVWQGKDKGDGSLICGFSGVSLDFANYLIERKLDNCAIILGPKEPPMGYYQNLIQIVSNSDEPTPSKALLDFERTDNKWNPKQFCPQNRVESLFNELTTRNELIFQGPPGTGKTFLMAEFVSKLLDLGKSVLVTALTNRALIELAEKESLEQHLKAENIMKTNVSADEKANCRYLIPVDSKKITCEPGKLTLSTFYNSSGWAKEKYFEPPFDYVIMDEASQAVFAMVAATKNLGKKVIWIGDQNQMQPIILLNEEILVRNDFGLLANGFQTLCNNFDYQSYILTKTYRLLPKAAELTSSFYPIALESVADFEYIFANSKLPYLPKNGGCFVLFKDMPKSERADIALCNSVIQIVSEILGEQPKIEIAVLSKFIASVRMLQKCCIDNIGYKNNILIDTVERVQGMTCDVCIYFIPNDLMSMSLDVSLFNVATSRAKQATIIVADKNIMSEPMSDEVRKYLLKAQEDSFATFESKEPKTISSGNIKVSVVGKIDLPENKGKTYVIDTNVFVECPDIINKIGNKNKIIIPAKVLDELDKLKLKPETDKQKLNKASRNIAEAFTKKFSKMEAADVSLLPVGFDKKTPDCMILSVALKHKDEKVILLTSDLNLQARASGLNIKVKSLRDFLKNN